MGMGFTGREKFPGRRKPCAEHPQLGPLKQSLRSPVFHLQCNASHPQACPQGPGWGRSLELKEPSLQMRREAGRAAGEALQACSSARDPKLNKHPPPAAVTPAPSENTLGLAALLPRLGRRHQPLCPTAVELPTLRGKRPRASPTEPLEKGSQPWRQYSG